MLSISGTLTMQGAGEITNSGGDYSINDNGIELAGQKIGKGGSSPASSLTWDIGAGADRAGLITTFMADATPTLDEATLWIAGGYDDSLQRGVGNVLIEGNSIILDGQDIPIKNHDTVSLGTGEQVLDVTVPIMEVTSAAAGTRIVEINLINQTPQVGMQITVINHDSGGANFGWRDDSQTSHTGANIQANLDANYDHRNNTAMILTLGQAGWYVTNDHGA